MEKKEGISELLSTIEKLCNVQEYDKARQILNRLKSTDYIDHYDIQKFHLLSGVCDYEKGDLTSAIEHLSKCINIANDNNRLSLKSNALYELSLCYFAMFQNSKKTCDLLASIDYCKQSLNELIDYSLIKKSTGFMEYYIETAERYLSVLVHLAVLYQAKKDFEGSNSLLEVAMACCKRYYDWRTLGVVYDELGLNNLYLGKSESALYYYEKALNVKRFIGNTRGIKITINNLICLLQENSKYLDSRYNSFKSDLQQVLEEENL